MGQKEKLIAKLKTTPKNFTFDDSNKGKTSGSRVKFESEIYGAILLHKPHPQKELKAYQIKQLVEKLEQEGLI